MFVYTHTEIPTGEYSVVVVLKNSKTTKLSVDVINSLPLIMNGANSAIESTRMFGRNTNKRLKLIIVILSSSLVLLSINMKNVTC